MVDLSIIIPGIRTNRWEQVYNTSKLACTKYSYEIVFVGPYELPDSLKNIPNVRFIKDLGSVTRCIQIGSKEAYGEYLARTDDDGDFFAASLDKSLDLIKKSNRKDSIGLRYREGKNFQGKVQPESYWYAKTHLKNMNIPDHYKICGTLMTKKDYFYEIGGYDCVFEHIAYASHDFCYRVQRDGGNIILSPTEVTNNNWTPGRKGDHAPIYDGQTQHDEPTFRKIQLDPNVHNRIKIDYDNWKQSPEIWVRRFGK